ncbi:MAG: hypothetical protein ACQESB_06330 [Elusimicrobiota bacterium]
MKIKKLPLLLSLLACFLYSHAGASEVDIGEDLQFEYRFLKREDDSYSQLRHRLRLYLKAYLDKNITIGASIQSPGIADSTQTYINYEGSKVKNKTPFFDSAYIKVDDIHDMPLSLTMGIQSLQWLDGLLISDRGMGLPGLSFRAELPYEIGVEGYRVMTEDSRREIPSIEGSGLRIMRKFGFMRAEANYLEEQYEESEEITRSIYGANLSREMHQGLEFSLFNYIMDGKIGESSFKSSLLGAYGSFEGAVEPIGKGGAWLRYILGGGDLDNEEEGFMPVLAHASADMIGHYYGRHRESSLSYTAANLDLFSFGIYAYVTEDLKVSMTRGLYKSQTPSLPLGGSISFGADYTYDRINVNFKHTIFSPEEDHRFFEGKEDEKFITLNVGAKF